MGDKEQLLEDPIGLIRETRNNFSLVNDVESLSNVTRNIDELQRLIQEKVKSRDEEVRQLDAAGRKTENRLEVLRQAQLASNSNGRNRSSSMDETAQLAQELEELEQRLLAMRTEVDQGLQDLVREGSSDRDRELVEEARPVDRAHKANILKIQVFRSLGVVLNLSNRTAVLNRAGTLDVVALDDSSSEFYRTKYLWDRL
ncbi:LAME_0A04654g1_1 [Lachancea meyersii CBS 8951]|uniref:Kinetochore protein Spc24 n=1 Tax=Lachancea meyersii CBS 8951 TaxID=1266667 RepID=A0A1G4IPA5_9SACH|nr:LAME_0A04654g1_1 [Lachancea meyersii CBS 8951]